MSWQRSVGRHCPSGQITLPRRPTSAHHLIIRGSAMTAHTRRRLLVLAPAVAAVTVLAACGHSSSSKTTAPPTPTRDCAQYHAYARHSRQTLTPYPPVPHPDTH